MIERIRSDCKYVEIFTYRVGSRGAPSRRTDLSEGQTPNVKRSQIPNIASKNTKANIFRNNNNNNNSITLSFLEYLTTLSIANLVRTWKWS
jgi:hypothetical protein